MVGEAGADGVEVGVGQRFDQVRGADGTGVEAVLPKVAAGSAEAIGAQGVGVMGLAESFGHGVEMGGDGDDVDVVRHQAPAEDGEAVLIALAAQEVEVEKPIGVGSENGLAVVAALGDVVRYVDRHDPRLAGHKL